MLSLTSDRALSMFWDMPAFQANMSEFFRRFDWNSSFCCTGSLQSFFFRDGLSPLWVASALLHLLLVCVGRICVVHLWGMWFQDFVGPCARWNSWLLWPENANTVPSIPFPFSDCVLVSHLSMNLVNICMTLWNSKEQEPFGYFILVSLRNTKSARQSSFWTF